MRQLNTETKYFFKAGAIIFELAKRQKVPLSMAIVDIDDLSLINQKYGDHIADMIVEDVNQSLVKKCRKSDLVSYLGEGRFGLLLYNISGINADIVLNDIRKMVAKKRYRLKEEIFNINVSIGAIIIHSYMNEDVLESLYDKVYLATNAAKAKGKDRVVVY